MGSISHIIRTGELNPLTDHARVGDVQSTTHRRPAKARIRFRRAQFEADAAEMGANNDIERARILGMDKGTYSGVIHGRQDPGGKFCAHVLHLFPGRPFERYFEIVDGP